MRCTSSGAAIFTRIQSGLRGVSTVGITFTGIRATFSAPRSLIPCSGLRFSDIFNYSTVFDGGDAKNSSISIAEMRIDRAEILFIY